MSKHTPGPWTVGSSDLPCSMTSVHATGGADRKWSTLARMVSPKYGVGVWESEANARLIAAAPDLLAALQALLMEHGGTLGCQRSDERAVAVRAAIAKATGESYD